MQNIFVSPTPRQLIRMSHCRVLPPRQVQANQTQGQVCVCVCGGTVQQQCSVSCALLAAPRRGKFHVGVSPIERDANCSTHCPTVVPFYAQFAVNQPCPSLPSFYLPSSLKCSVEHRTLAQCFITLHEILTNYSALY